MNQKDRYKSYQLLEQRYTKYQYNLSSLYYYGWWSFIGCTAIVIITTLLWICPQFIVWYISQGVTISSFFIFISYGIPYIARDTSPFQKTYYKKLPWYLYVILWLLIISIFRNIDSWLSASLRSLIILRWFIFFDSRYFAIMALYMLIRIIIATLLNDDIGANNFAIYLYYYLILTVLFSLIESKLWFDQTTIEDKK